MNEFELIDTIKQPTYRQTSLIKGVGDDAAVFRSEGHDVVTAVDTFVENVHFSTKTMDEVDIGYRVLAVNISDIAAMGASPKFYLVSIVIPPQLTDKQVQDIFKGMEEIASTYKMDLIGGDTVSGDKLMISVTVIGYVHRDKVRYRHNASENDLVFVTGTVGDASCGLHILLNELDVDKGDYFVERHRRPTPRVEFAKDLQEISRLALNDISDGIANELHEIAVASNLSIEIEDDLIPVSEAMRGFTKEEQDNWKYFGGEDFELVGTVSKQNWSEVVDIANAHGLQVTKIGSVKQQSMHPVLLRQDNKIIPLEKKGFIHKK